MSLSNQSCDFRTLLPHPSDVELALEQEAASKYCRLNENLIRDLHDPWKCPVEFLPWLAYALSVDVWNNNWPEQIKRSICANAIELHRHKGTHGGVEDALAALGVKPIITYWHEMQPEGEPGTMDLMVWVTQAILPNADILLDAELIADIKAQIDSTKRATLHYSYKIGVATDTAMGLGYSAEISSLTWADMPQSRVDIQPNPVALSLACSAELTTLNYMDMTL